MSKIFKPISIIFLAFICWIIYSADTGRNNIFFDVVNWLPFGDKIGHFFLFGILTLVVNITLKFRQIKFWKRLPLGSVIVSTLVLLEELSQAFFPNRTLDISDLIADGLGILCFTILGQRLNKKTFYKSKSE